jgi:hypothetical protein
MAPKYHAPPLSGGDRKAFTRELGRARALTSILARQPPKPGAKGRLRYESWNERMWADGEPIDPSPTVDQAINSGHLAPLAGSQKFTLH